MKIFVEFFHIDDMDVHRLYSLNVEKKKRKKKKIVNQDWLLDKRKQSRSGVSVMTVVSCPH
jgi:hypothetical protein